MSPRATVLHPGQGRLIAGAGMHAMLKVAGGDKATTSTFEVRVPPNFDVGAHYHNHGEELFYIVEGELDLMAFEPIDRSVEPWWEWRGRNGETVDRYGRGSLMHIPHGIPHAFRNPTNHEAVMLFQAGPRGHEDYFEELIAFVVASGGNPDADQLKLLRARHDVHQISDRAKLS